MQRNKTQVLAYVVNYELEILTGNNLVEYQIVFVPTHFIVTICKEIG